MMHVLSMPWLRDVANEASPAAQEGTDSAVVSGQGLASSSHVSAVCQVNAGPALRDSFARASSPGRHASGPSVLNLSRDYSTRHTVTSEDIMCKCKGHCRIFRHREQGKCVEAALVKHTGYCVKCLCKVYGCDSAKHKSDFCYMHKRILEQLPVHARLAVLAADVAHRLVPCEILDFLTIYEEIKSDLAMCIICAMVYEPAANAIILAQWRQLPPDYDAQALAKRLEAALRACGSTPGRASGQPSDVREPEQHEEARRCCGVAACGESLGLLRKAPHKAQGMSLGTPKQNYVFTGDTTTLTEFLMLVRTETKSGHPPCFDAREPGVFNQVQRYGHRLRRLMHGMAHDTNPTTANGTGCIVDTVVRTLCMPLYERMPWDHIPASNVQATSGSLASFPKTWTASQLSAFVCQRPDWAWLAPVFTRLWKEYADSEPDALAIVSKMCTTPPGASMPCALTMAADAFFHQFGYSPRPCVLLQDQASVCPKRSLKAHVAPPKKRTATGRASAESTQEQRWWHRLQPPRPQHQ